MPVTKARKNHALRACLSSLLLSRFVVLAIGCSFALMACGPKGLAELKAFRGKVEKSKSTEKSWSEAALGATFHFGDAVRTNAKASARLRIVGGSQLEMAESTTIRFGAATVSEATYAIDIEAGEAELIGAAGGSKIQLDVGLASLASNSRLRLRPDGGTLTVDVLVGSAVIDSGQNPIELRVGSRVTIDIGGSIVERPVIPDAGVDVPDASATVTDAGPIDIDASALDASVAGSISATLSGRGAKIRTDPEEDWERVEEGEKQFAPGTSVKLPRRAKLELQRGDERANIAGPALIVVAPAGGELLALQNGTGVIHGTSTDVRISVPGGVIVARRASGAGSRGEIRIRGRDTLVTPKSGTLILEGKKGGREHIGLGESATLRSIGGIEVKGRAPKRADFSITAGESATIHDPKPPTAIRVRFGKLCPEEGVVEISSRSFKRSSALTRGKQSAIVRIRGSQRYRIRCIVDGALQSKVQKKGRLRVRRDSGVRPLPRKPTHNYVDADGRRYTVLYQNHLPKLTFRWPRQTARGSYTLNIKPSSGSLTSLTTSQPRYTMGSGKLREGTYDFWFQLGAARSTTSKLKIEFDNASPTAHIRSPKPGAEWGGTVTASGAALRGWAVSLHGKKLLLDRHSRFSTTVSKPGNGEAIAIRFAHRARGVHYYIRRSGGKK